LKNSSIDDKTSQIWLQQLVDTYTKSLDTSNNLVDIEVINTVEKIRNKSTKVSNNVKQKK